MSAKAEGWDEAAAWALEQGMISTSEERAMREENPHRRSRPCICRPTHRNDDPLCQFVPGSEEMT